MQSCSKILLFKNKKFILKEKCKMKIRIELTNKEVQKLKETSQSVTSSILKSVDEDFSTDRENEFQEKFDKIFESETSNKIGKFSAQYCDTTEEGVKDSVINIDLNTDFVQSMLGLADIFYVAIADFITKIKTPFEKFAEKYM